MTARGKIYRLLRPILVASMLLALVLVSGCRWGDDGDAVPVGSFQPQPEDSPSPEMPSPSAEAPSPSVIAPDPSPGALVDEQSYTHTYRADDGATLLSASIAVPQLGEDEGTPSAREMVNGYYQSLLNEGRLYAEIDLQDMARRERQRALDMGGLFSFYRYEQNYTIEYNSGNILSVSREIVEYTGGVHEGVSMKAESYDLDTGYRLTLDDFFTVPVSQYLPRIMGELARQADEGGSALYYENVAQLLEDHFEPLNFCLTGSALSIFYQPATVASYTAGVCRFDIELDVLEDIWKAQ